MILVVGTVRTPPENLARARPLMSALVARTRHEDGCLSYSFAEDVGEPGLIRIAEAWRDEAALGVHFTQPHFTAWREQAAALGLYDRNLTVHEAAWSKPL